MWANQCHKPPIWEWFIALAPIKDGLWNCFTHITQFFFTMFVICRISHDSTSYRNGHLEGWRHTGWTSIMSAINLVDCYTIHLYPIHLRITLVVNISFFWSLSISYLVGGLNPSWKIWKSMGRIIPHIMENKSHVPNHQPGYVGTSKNLILLLPSTSQMYQHQPRD